MFGGHPWHRTSLARILASWAYFSLCAFAFVYIFLKFGLDKA